MANGPAAHPRPLTAGQLFTITAAGAILCGLAEASNSVYRHRIDHLPTGEFVAGEVFWMAPLAALCVLGAVWLLWTVLTRPAPVGWGLRDWGPPVAAALATWSLASALSLGIAFWAEVILAAGVGLSLRRAMAARPGLVVGIARVVLGTGAAAMTLVAVLVPWRRQAAEAQALASLPPATAGAPNVLVLIWDTARALNLSLYGYPRPTTPVLDSLAAHGATFERAFAVAPWSLPSHASMFTGRYPHELTTGHRLPLDATHPTVAEHFSANGYATAGVTANLFYGSRDYGIARGFSMYDERPPIAWRVIGHTYRLSRRVLQVARNATGEHGTLLRRRAPHVNASLAAWLDRTGGRPFFAVLNYFDAHEPYAPPAPFDTAFAPRGARYWADETLASAPPEVTQQLRDVYDGALRYVDHSLGELLALLRARGGLENTIIVVTSDHGEEFGERHPASIGHNRSLYRHALQVPLVLVYPPRIAPGVRSRAPVSIRDIPATVADLARPDVAHPFPGTELARLVAEPAVADTSEPTRLALTEKHRWGMRREGWPTSWGSVYSVFDSTMQYVVDAFGTEQLFDLDRDPFDADNLAGRADLQPRLLALRQRLEAYVGPPATRVARFGATPSAPPALTGAQSPGVR
jgi:arylsulfatase A-like enzyme